MNYIISDEELKALYKPYGVVNPELLSLAFDILKSKKPIADWDIVTTGKIKGGYIDIEKNELCIRFENTTGWSFKNLFSPMGTWSIALKKESEL